MTMFNFVLLSLHPVSPFLHFSFYMTEIKVQQQWHQYMSKSIYYVKWLIAQIFIKIFFYFLATLYTVG